MGSLRLDRESPSVDGSYELPECAMELIEMMRDVVEQSGLAALWQQVAPRLALDLRQLIFVAATPFFVGVAVWEYRRIRHDPNCMDSAGVAAQRAGNDHDARRAVSSISEAIFGKA